MKVFLTLASLVISVSAFAHGAHHHDPSSHSKTSSAAREEQKLSLNDIAKAYDNEVRPIFATKCAACHSEEVKSPWYAAIPGVHQLVESDRSEAKEHLDISKGFPFSGHGDVESDLKAIRDVVESGDMPPLRYRIVHWNSAITDTEKTAILKWISESENKLHISEQEKSGDKK